MENDNKWAHLPQEILGKIFSYVGFYDRSLTVSLVCRDWAKVCYDPLLNKSYTIKGHELSYDEILQKLRAAPYLRYLRITDRNDLNSFLKEVGKHNRKLKFLKIKKCLGSTKCQKTISSAILMSLLTKCKMIEDLTIKSSPIRSKKLFLRLGTMIPKLKKICLTIDLDSKDLSMVIKGCRNLESIKLPTSSKNAVKYETIQEICNEIGGRLKTLKLNASLLTDSSIDCLLQKCKNLKMIHLIRPTYLSDKAISKLSQFPDLTSLSITYKQTRWLEIDFFHDWSARLNVLNLSACTTVDDSLLNKISLHCIHLMKLDISRCYNFTNNGLSKILKHCSKLVYLNLYLTPYSLIRELNPKNLLQYNLKMLKRLVYRPFDCALLWPVYYKEFLMEIQLHCPHLQVLSFIEEDVL